LFFCAFGALCFPATLVDSQILTDGNVFSEFRVFRKEDKWFLGRSEEYRRGLERNAHIIRRVVELQLSPEEASTFANIVGELLPISGLHHAMFIPTLQGYVRF
jgi:hypothetical protein